MVTYTVYMVSGEKSFLNVRVKKMLEMQNVCFSYGRRQILNDLSFSVREGECLVLAGPNGSGKSTALSIAAGVLSPDSGSVRSEGGIGYVPQGTGLFEDMSVADNLRFFAGLAGCPVPEKLPFGVEKYLKKRVGRLSGGMKKQLSIACSLLGEPKVLLFDEPCASLDIRYRDELTDMVKRLKAEGRAVVYVGHDPAEFAPFYDRLLFFGGEISEYTKAQLSGDTADDRRLNIEFSKLYKERGETK